MTEIRRLNEYQNARAREIVPQVVHLQLEPVMKKDYYESTIQDVVYSSQCARVGLQPILIYLLSLFLVHISMSEC